MTLLHTPSSIASLIQSIYVPVNQVKSKTILVVLHMSFINKKRSRNHKRRSEYCSSSDLILIKLMLKPPIIKLLKALISYEVISSNPIEYPIDYEVEEKLCWSLPPILSNDFVENIFCPCIIFSMNACKAIFIKNPITCPRKWLS